MKRIRRYIRTLIIVSILFFTTLIVKAQQMLPYQNPQLSVEERVNDLLGRMHFGRENRAGYPSPFVQSI